MEIEVIRTGIRSAGWNLMQIPIIGGSERFLRFFYSRIIENLFLELGKGIEPPVIPHYK